MMYVNLNNYSIKFTVDEGGVQVLLFDAFGRFKAALAFKEWTSRQYRRIRTLIRRFFGKVDPTFKELFRKAAQCYSNS